MSTLSVTSLSKQYSHKKALDGVSLSFEAGAVYALLGENGAGKSTLASLLAGDSVPTSGSIELNGEQVLFRSPKDALAHGIAMVRQQPLLVDELTVLENCMLGNEKSGAAGTLKKRAALTELLELERSWGISVVLEKKAASLTAPERLFGTLLVNLYRSPRFLLLDEPSATLDEKQRTELFTRLRKAAHQDGLCIIFITHSIQEALDYADCITVLQKGHVVFSEDIWQKKPAVSDIADMLFVHKESRGFTFAAHTAGTLSESTAPLIPKLELRDVTVRPSEGAALFNVSFSVPAGKLTLISGQRESGMDTLENLVTGMFTQNGFASSLTKKQFISGSLFFDGELLKKPLTPRFLRERGTAIIPFRKMQRASHPDLTIAELLGSTGADPVSILKQVQTDISAAEKVSALSGGMLQRLIIARELFSNPSFVIMSSPSYGLDRFSTEKVRETVSALLSQGTTVLVLGDESQLEPLADKRYELVSGHLAEKEVML